MISPKDQKIIQIEITNACPFSCSHCTRFVGHHKQPFFMDFETFKRAVDSLADYPGMVGIMGGEPTLHPEFERFVRYLDEKRPERKDLVRLNPYLPIEDFTKHRNVFLSNINRKKGIWSSLGPGYARHFELIQDVFQYQCINDHRHDGEHIALMLPYKELGISDSDFIKYRDNCWVQREWSASITPKGAFFCEVAAAFDMLFNGAGGWLIEPGWWKRTPEQFTAQLKYCELCSACLPVPRKKASSKVDIVSPGMLKKLQEIGSKKIAGGQFEVFDIKTYDPKKYKVNQSCEPYLPPEGNAARVSGTNSTIKPWDITGIMVCVGYDDYLDKTLPFNVKELDRIIVVTDEFDKKTPLVCRKHGVECVVSKRIHENKAVFAKGKGINRGIDYLKSLDAALEWVLVMDADIILPAGFGKKIKSLTLNPGALHYTRRWGPSYPEQIQGFMKELSSELTKGLSQHELFNRWANKEQAKVEGRKGNAIEAIPFGYFQLFNLRAQVLRDREPGYPELSNTAENDDRIFGLEIFPREKQVQLPPGFDVIHLPHGLYRQNWSGRISPRLDQLSRKLPARVTKQERYICRTKCLYRGRIWEPGEVATFKGLDVPKHFGVYHGSK